MKKIILGLLVGGAVFLVPAFARASILIEQGDHSGVSMREGGYGALFSPGSGYSGTWKTAHLWAAHDGASASIVGIVECDDPQLSGCHYIATSTFSAVPKGEFTITFPQQFTLAPDKYYGINFEYIKDGDLGCTDNYDGASFGGGVACDGVGGAPYFVITDEEVVRSGREPVVIVPGILGSRLNNVADGSEVWPNADAMARPGKDSYLDALKLSSSGTPIAGKEMTPSDIIRTVTTSIPFVEKDIFAPLIDSLVAQGYASGTDLFVAPYDWRFGIASSAASVGAVMQDAASHSPDGKINVIAHSMGGLAIKEYLASATSVFLDKLILAGVPQLGAPVAFKLLNYGDDLGLSWFGFGLNPKEAKSISQNMQGVYDLLPSRRYVQNEGGYVFMNQGSTPLNYNDTGRLMTSDTHDSRNHELIGAADALHRSIDANSVNAPEVYNLVGCGRPTIKKFILGSGNRVGITRGNGDGSVPVDSAMNLANGYQNYFVLGAENGIDHTRLISDDRSVSFINAILDDATSSFPLPSSGISTSAQDCEGGSSGSNQAITLEISSQGSGELNVYDAAGRHTGPNANGSIETGIPGSSYETLGESAFVLVPAGAHYRITGNGAKRAGRIEVKEYDAGVRVIREEDYDAPLDRQFELKNDRD